MLELKKTECSPELARLCAENGAAMQTGDELFAALCGGVVGCCVFALEGEALVLRGVWADAAFGGALCDGLVRAVYQHALGRGARTASFSPAFPENAWRELQAFGHTHKTDNDIDNFLTNCKNCAP